MKKTICFLLCLILFFVNIYSKNESSKTTPCANQNESIPFNGPDDSVFALAHLVVDGVEIDSMAPLDEYSKNFEGITFGVAPAIQDSIGRFIVPGYQGFTNNFAVVRLSVNGGYDTSFGFGTGRVVGNTNDIAQVFGAALNTNGKNLIFANKLITGNVVVIELNIDCSIDFFFGPFGRRNIMFGGTGVDITGFFTNDDGRFFLQGFLSLTGILGLAI